MTSHSVHTLFVTKHLPYPPMGGSALRNWQNINVMMKLGSVAGISVHSDGSSHDAEFPPGVDLWSNYPVAEITKQRSVWQKIENRLWWLRPYGHQWSDQLYGKIVAQELDRVLAELHSPLVIFEEIWLYRYLPIAKKHGCRVILDNHNVEGELRRNIHNSEKELKSKIKSSLFVTKVEAIERDFCQQVDQVWVCSHSDEDLLQKSYGPKLPTQVVPNAINVAYYDCVRLGTCNPPAELAQVPWTIVFTAAFAYQPNSVAAQLLIDQIFPQLRKANPNCRLILVGRNPTPYMKEAAKRDSGIVVTGKVPDVRPYLAAASVVIVPLLDGGGTRLKLLEAFAAGRPVVSTAKGAEGLSVQDGEHLLIRNSVEELVEGVCQLWAEPSLGQKLVQTAYELVRKEYSWEAAGQRVEKALQEFL